MAVLVVAFPKVPESGGGRSTRPRRRANPVPAVAAVPLATFRKLVGLFRPRRVNRLDGSGTLGRMATLGVAMIGCGGIALQNHLPGFALCPDTKVVALCDANPATLEKASRETGIQVTSTDWREIVTRDDVHAVVIATPNVFHAPIAIAAT